MKRLSRFLIYICLFLIGNGMLVRSQSVRSLVNGGNDLYDAKKYTDAEVEYRKSLEKDKNLLQGNFNLGDAVYKQNHYDEAIREYTNALGKTTDPNMQAKIYHNIGNAYCSSNQYHEGVNAYTKALKCNPKDDDTRYNLAYALKKIREQQQQEKKDQKKNDQKDKNKDKQDQVQNQKHDNTQNQQQKQQQPERKISKQEAERILEALKNDEKRTEKKMQKKVPVRINVDKDW